VGQVILGYYTMNSQHRILSVIQLSLYNDCQRAERTLFDFRYYLDSSLNQNVLPARPPDPLASYAKLKD